MTLLKLKRILTALDEFISNEKLNALSSELLEIIPTTLSRSRSPRRNYSNAVWSTRGTPVDIKIRAGTVASHLLVDQSLITGMSSVGAFFLF